MGGHRPWKLADEREWLLARIRARIQPMIERGDLPDLMQLKRIPRWPRRSYSSLSATPMTGNCSSCCSRRRMRAGLSWLLRAYRRASFDATMKDPEFVKDAQAQTLYLNPVAGQQIAETLSRVYKLPAKLVGKVNALSKQ